MAQIHPTAIVHPKAELGNDVSVGPFTVIESDVIIGNGCRIHSHVYIDSGTRLGERVVASKGAVLGTAPQDLKYAGEKTYLEVGDDTVIREYATLNRGTDFHYKTVVGKNCFLMAYSHVAHDCIIGNNVIIANAVNMAGHVTIEDNAGIGGMTAIHQFVSIGQHCFVGGGLRIIKDVPPYILVMGEPARYGGVNRVGLLRKGFSEESINNIKRAYRILFKSELMKQEAIDQIRKELPHCTEVAEVVRFLVENSNRGILKG